MTHLWLKAFHLIGVVAWFAGLFYIFRLYVYHVEHADEPTVVRVLKVMERRLYRAICWPAMVFTTIFGLALLAQNAAGYLQATWFQIKLVGLLGLFTYHFYSGWIRRQLENDQIRLSSRQCRIINEAPTVLLVLIVIMAVVKPFAG